MLRRESYRALLRYRKSTHFPLQNGRQRCHAALIFLLEWRDLQLLQKTVLALRIRVRAAIDETARLNETDPNAVSQFTAGRALRRDGGTVSTRFLLEVFRPNPGQVEDTSTRNAPDDDGVHDASARIMNEERFQNYE